MNAEVAFRLTLRFSSALAIFSEIRAKDVGDWRAALHPTLETYLRVFAPKQRYRAIADLERVLLEHWEKSGGSTEDPRARLRELVCCLELSLAPEPSALASHIETCHPWLSPVQRMELYQLGSTHARTEEERRRLRAAAFLDLPAPLPNREMSSRKAEEAAKVEPLLQATAAAPDGGFTLTKTQAAVADQLIRFGNLFFSKDRPRLPIEPRLSPLVAGRTGAGKGHVIRHVARALDCELIHTTYASWVVNGASLDFFPTLWLILEKLTKSERVLVLLDELDKLDTSFASDVGGWTRSVGNEIWGLLDRRLPVTEYLRSSRSDQLDTDENRSTLENKCRNSLWIVGVGTWQNLLKPAPRKVGFTAGRQINEGRDAGALIWSQGGISDELLARFNPGILELGYPSAEELATFLREAGIESLAQDRGVSVDPRSLDLTRGGMRVVEDLLTQLLLLPKAA